MSTYEEKEKELAEKLKAICELLDDAQKFADENGLWLEFYPVRHDDKYYASERAYYEEMGWSPSSIGC